MGFGIPCHLFPAEGADRFVTYGEDLAWAGGIGILFSPPQADGEEFLVCYQPRIAIQPQIPLVLQYPFDHVLIPLGSMLMVAHTLLGHLVSDLVIGTAQQVVGEDIPYRLCFLWVTGDSAILNLVPKWCFSLPRHLPNHPFYAFRQLQPIQ